LNAQFAGLDAEYGAKDIFTLSFDQTIYFQESITKTTRNQPLSGNFEA
jgi:hypothetical protein